MQVRKLARRPDRNENSHFATRLLQQASGAHSQGAAPRPISRHPAGRGALNRLKMRPRHLRQGFYWVSRRSGRGPGASFAVRGTLPRKSACHSPVRGTPSRKLERPTSSAGGKLARDLGFAVLDVPDLVATESRERILKAVSAFLSRNWPTCFGV